LSFILKFLSSFNFGLYYYFLVYTLLDGLKSIFFTRKLHEYRILSVLVRKHTFKTLLTNVQLIHLSFLDESRSMQVLFIHCELKIKKKKVGEELGTKSCKREKL